MRYRNAKGERMLFSILVFFQILAGLVAGEATIRSTPQGAKSIDVLSKSGLFFLKWRAYADYKKELKGLRNTFGILAIVFTAILFLWGPTERGSFFNAIPGFFLILWMTMQFGTNFKKSIKEQIQIVGLFVIGPWLILGLDYLTEFQFNQLRLIASPFNTFGIQSLDTYQIAIYLSLVGVSMGLLISISTIFLLSIIPLFLLFLMVSLSKLSRAVLYIQPRTAKNFAFLYCYIVGPVLMALESKGII